VAPARIACSNVRPQGRAPLRHAQLPVPLDAAADDDEVESTANHIPPRRNPKHRMRVFIVFDAKRS